MRLVCIGSIAYWYNLLLDNHSVLFVNHTFQKQSTLSQYEIVTANGRLKMSVPTIKATRKGSYSNVIIDRASNWQVVQWRSIENAYQKSPFFLYYGDKIGVVFKAEYTTLFQFNLALFKVLCICLKIKENWSVNKDKPCFFTETICASNKHYPQVFDSKIDFEKNLSVLDLIFNLGPEAADYLASL